MLVGHAEREVFPKVNLVIELSPTPARVLHYGPVDQVCLVVIGHNFPPLSVKLADIDSAVIPLQKHRQALIAQRHRPSESVRPSLLLGYHHCGLVVTAGALVDIATHDERVVRSPFALAAGKVRWG